jgi:hypothetical protein
MDNKDIISCVSASLLKFSSLLEGLKKVQLIAPTEYVKGEIDVLTLVAKELEASGVQYP